MASQSEIRESITNQIVEALKSGGLPPWRRPWGVSGNSGFPTNAVSGRRYSGVNVLLLQMASMRHQHRSKFWGTFNQWTAMNGRIKKRPDNVLPGQWGCQIVFFKPITKTVFDRNTGEEREESFPLLRTYTCFNIDQVEGDHLDHLRAKDEEPTSSEFLDFSPADEALKATGADIRFGGDRAFYEPIGDFIQMPPKHRFNPAHEFYGTACHEAMHWTGHVSRLNRLKSGTRFGDQNYAFEELVAEIGAAFLLAELGVPQSGDPSNHNSYVASWLKSLQNDSRYIFRAATAASKAADYVLSFSRQPEPEAVLV